MLQLSIFLTFFISGVLSQTLVQVSYNPPVLNTTLVEGTVTLNLGITTGASKLHRVYARIGTEDGVDEAFSSVSNLQKVGQSFPITMTVTRGVKPGVWILRELQVFVTSSNYHIYHLEELETFNSASNLTVYSQIDDSLPQLVSLQLASTYLNATESNVLVEFNITATDQWTGISTVNFYLTAPNSGSISETIGGVCTITYGDSHDGVYACSATVPWYQSTGNYTLEFLELKDQRPNNSTFTGELLRSMGFETQIFVQTTPDDIAPSMESFTLSSNFIEPGDSGEIAMTMHVKDNLSGFLSAMVTFYSIDSYIIYGYFTLDNLISGTPLDGVYQSTVQFTHAPDIWQIHQISLHDRNENGNHARTNQFVSISGNNQNCLPDIYEWNGNLATYFGYHNLPFISQAASICPHGDKDYYNFDITEPTNISAYLKLANDGSDKLRMSVWNIDKKSSLIQATAINDKEFYLSIALQPGNYSVLLIPIFFEEIFTTSYLLQFGTCDLHPSTCSPPNILNFTTCTCDGIFNSTSTGMSTTTSTANESSEATVLVSCFFYLLLFLFPILV